MNCNCCAPAYSLPFTITTQNTSSANMTGNGSSGSPLKVNVRKSAQAGNALVINADGLYVPTVGSGSITGGANLGISGAKVFSGSVSNVLQFRRLVQGTNVTITENTNDILISASGGSGEVNTASNLGATGARVFSAKVGVDLQFRRILQGTNITVTENANDITLNGPIPGEINTASNLGVTGARVFSGKVGVDLQFRRIISGVGIVVTENIDDISVASNITINATLNATGTVAISADELVAYIIVLPANNGSNFKIGTTLGGGDIEFGTGLVAGQSYVYNPSVYFQSSGNLHFTNVPVGTIIKIKKF
jgi:hypothetical protein